MPLDDLERLEAARVIAIGENAQTPVADAFDLVINVPEITPTSG